MFIKAKKLLINARYKGNNNVRYISNKLNIIKLNNQRYKFPVAFKSFIK